MNNIAALRDHPDQHPDDFPVLPDGMERDGFIRLFENVAATMFGLTDAEISTFVCMAEDPRPSDWKRPDVEPCCWRRQNEIADRRSKSRFTINRHETTLRAVGLIDKRAMAHGARSGFDGCGIFFSPAIALVPAMLAHRAEREAVQKERNQLCNLRSIHKGHLKAALNDLADLAPLHPALGDLQASYEAWPDARLLRRMDLDALRQHVEDADLLTRSVLTILRETEDLQHGGCTNATPYIQDTTQEFTSVCNASVDRRSAGKPAHSEFSGSEPSGSKQCREKECGGPDSDRKDEIRFILTTEILYTLCSPDMQLYIDAHTEGPSPTEQDISWGAIQMLRELGINQSAWDDACSVMGQANALLSLIVTDANRFHPEIRVRNPGGYLRGMTRAARAGTLNLVGSLKGLNERVNNTH